MHIMTGPIYVCGAEPGDVLQVDILDLMPRKNPVSGKVRSLPNSTGNPPVHATAQFMLHQ